MTAAILRYECFNALRSKWLYAYTSLLTTTIFGLAYLAADIRRTELVLISVLILLVPLVSMLFTTAYWYGSELFTELLVAQPVSRRSIFWARIISIVASLTTCLAIALFVPTVTLFGFDRSLVWLFLGMALAGAVFCCLGTLVATYVIDRLWGIGLGLAIWFYFIAVHDGLLLLLLYWFREYPLDHLGAGACAFNALSIVRVGLLLYFDAPLLLGHAGALVSGLAEGKMVVPIFFGLIGGWLVIPLVFAQRRFARRDF